MGPGVLPSDTQPHSSAVRVRMARRAARCAQVSGNGVQFVNSVTPIVENGEKSFIRVFFSGNRLDRFSHSPGSDETAQ